jgi:ABC-type transporter Mla subunit MlaD
MPALDQPTAEVRKHFQDASTKSKVLANLLQKAPQPHVALAARSDLSDAYALFAMLPTLTAPSKTDTIEPLHQVLERAAEALNSVALTISSATQHRQPRRTAIEAQREQLRARVARLAGVCRKQLGRPYHSHVATIAALFSNIPTNTDYVKKIDKRNLGGRSGDKTLKNRKQSVP